MTKTQAIINSLKKQINNNEDSGDDMDAASWGYQQGVLLSGNQAQFILDILLALETDKELPPDPYSKLNGTVVEDEIMGQSIAQPEWHLDPTSLPATREDVINNMRFVMDSIDNLSTRLQTIEKKML